MRVICACLAAAALFAAPALSSEESVKKAEEKAPQQSGEKAPAAESAKPGEATENAKADEPAECQPGAARVNTFEDLFGLRGWSPVMAARTAGTTPVKTAPAGVETAVLWREVAPAPAPAKKPEAEGESSDDE